MGCDIHMRVEYLNDDGEWICGDFFRINEYYSGKDPSQTDPLELVEVWWERDYELFAQLADVRNYDDNEYICKPRGIPDDACARTTEAHDRWGCDAHSESYFTLEELVKWNERNDGKLKRSGYVSPETAQKLDTEGVEPNSWCLATSDDTWQYREWVVCRKPLDKLINRLEQRGEDLYLWFNRTYMRERMKNLRIVFWFDN